MHILCTICSDLMNPAENIYVTKCGHLFHYHCLSQWLARSKSCPQCRNHVTAKCIFRFFPTISNEVSGDDAATLQSKLDDAKLQLRQQSSICKEHEEKIATAEAEVTKNLALLKAVEKKLESRDSTIAALKEQLEYIKIQSDERQKLKEENKNLKKNMQTLNGLQKVLNATSDEVETMLEDYTDVRTVATFATALKRALCESESKKNESRDKLQALKQKLAAEKRTIEDLKAKLALTEENLTTELSKQRVPKKKRKRVPDLDKSFIEDSPSDEKKKRNNLNETINLTDTSNFSLNTMVNNIENADSPYLRLQQSCLALTALTRQHEPPNKNIKPSEYALLNSTRNCLTKKQDNEHSSKTSIFHKKEPSKVTLSQENDADMCLIQLSYDGMGSHCKLETFPVPNTRPALKNLIPKLTTKHKLKRPNPDTKQSNLVKMLESMKDKMNSRETQEFQTTSKF